MGQLSENNHKFVGTLSEEYYLLKLAYPHLEEFQGKIGKHLQNYHSGQRNDVLRVLEIGCGDGYTTNILLNSRNDIRVTAIDNESEMIQQARHNLRKWLASGNLEITEADALEYVSSLSEETFDVIASGWTIHNFLKSYRHQFLRETFRTLKTPGIFINGDKYAQNGITHHKALYEQFEIFFEVYLPAKKFNFLQEFVLHNLDDEAPNRIMHEAEAIQDMKDIGFKNITITYRHKMEAVLVAQKPV